MAAKAKENRAQRDSLKTQMFEIWEVAKSSQEQPSLRALLKRRFARAQSIFEKFEPLHSAILAHTAAQSEPDFAAEEQIRREFFEAFDEIEAICQLFSRNRSSCVNRNKSKHFVVVKLTPAEIVVTQF
jgi:hypothetical protein